GSRAAPVLVVNRVVHERFFLPGISRALGIFLLRAHRPPAVLWPRAANKTKEKRQQIASVSRAQPSATIKNAFHRHWSHDLFELGSDGRADLTQRRPGRTKLFHPSYCRLLVRVGNQPAVDNFKPKRSLSAAIDTLHSKMSLHVSDSLANAITLVLSHR